MGVTIGNRHHLEHDDDPNWDAVEANALYNLLENELIPEFYNRDENGIPKAWVARIRESMAKLTPQFSANRTVSEYTEKYYLPAAAHYLERACDKGVTGKKIIDWQHTLEQKWAAMRFGQFKVETSGQRYIFEAEVYLDDINPNAIRVELYADGINAGSPIRQKMKRGQKLPGQARGYSYSVKVSADRPATDYTARVIPNYDNVAIPLEAAQILWQR